VVRVVEEMKKVGIETLRGDEWEGDGEVVLRKGKVYIPKDKTLRLEVIQLYHDIQVARHGGK